MNNNLRLESILILFCLVASSWVSALSRESLPNRYVADFDSRGIDSRVALALENQLVWGYIDNTGKYVIPPIYDSADAFWHECAEVTKDGKTFYIDHKGNQTANRQPSGGGSDADFKKIIFEKDIYDHTGKKMVARGAFGIIVYPFSEDLAAFRMPLNLIQKYYPQHIPERYKTKNGFDSSDNSFGQCGYLDKSGRIVIPPKFEHAYPFKDGLAKVSGWRQNGYINKTGNYIGRHPCSDVGSFRNGLACCSMNLHHYFYIDRTGRIVLDNLESANDFCCERAAVQKDKKWFLIDSQGKRICDLDADKVGEFSQGYASITKDHKVGLIDKTGAVVVPMQYEEVGEFWEGVAPVAVALSDKERATQLESKKEWLCGYIDADGKLAVEPKYPGARNFAEGLAPVRVGLKWGYIDKQGAMVIAPRFDDAQTFSEGLAGVRVGYQWGFIDHGGNFVISPRFGPPSRKERQQLSVGRFSEGRVICRTKDFSHKYFDRSGKLCSRMWPGDFPTDENNFHEGLALVQTRPGCNWTGNEYVNTKDRIVSKVYYAKSSSAFSEGLAMVDYTTMDQKESPKSGFVDKNFKFVIPPIYGAARSFTEGLAAVGTGSYGDYGFEGKWGYVDKYGKKVIESQYDDAEEFHEGLAVIRIGDKWGVIDKVGAAVVPPRYDSIGNFSGGRAAVISGERFGYIDTGGRVVVPIKYWLAGPFCDGRALVVFPTNEADKVSPGR